MRRSASSAPIAGRANSRCSIVFGLTRTAARTLCPMGADNTVFRDLSTRAARRRKVLQDLHGRIPPEPDGRVRPRAGDLAGPLGGATVRFAGRLDRPRRAIRGGQRSAHLRAGSPRDAWLHVAAESGSHVVVRNPDGLERLPRDTLRFAAGLAARHSQARRGGRVAGHLTPCPEGSKPPRLPPRPGPPGRYRTLPAPPPAH